MRSSVLHVMARLDASAFAPHEYALARLVNGEREHPRLRDAARAMLGRSQQRLSRVLLSLMAREAKLTFLTRCGK